MSKLEIKHLIPYLNYKLQVTYGGINCELEGIDVHANQVIVERIGVDLDKIKPILHPLSDLEKVCTDIGDMCTLELIFGSQYRRYLNLPKGGQSTGQLYPWERTPLLWKTYQIEHLFRLHFDVFGLIDKGLAVDINTL